MQTTELPMTWFTYGVWFSSFLRWSLCFNAAKLTHRMISLQTLLCVDSELDAVLMLVAIDCTEVPKEIHSRNLVNFCCEQKKSIHHKLGKELGAWNLTILGKHYRLGTVFENI